MNGGQVQSEPCEHWPSGRTRTNRRSTPTPKRLAASGNPFTPGLGSSRVRWGLLLAVLLLAGCARPPAEAPRIGNEAMEGTSPAHGTDPLFHLQWNLQLSRVPEAWAHATGRNVTIAFLDSGIDLKHPDLRDKLVLVDGANLWGDSVQDLSGHGTGVAGIAAASTHNGIGIAGVAPAAMIMPIRVFEGEGPGDRVEAGFSDRIATAIRLAADEGAHVISMSFGMNFAGGAMDIEAPQVSEAIEHAWSKGVILVAAGGNNAGPLCVDPAAHPRVLCVGNVDRAGERADDSNFDLGSNFVVAPAGEAFSSTFNCRSLTLTTSTAGFGYCDVELDGASYSVEGGTSYAAPLVAGLGALLVEMGLTNEQAIERIKRTADPNWPYAGTQGINGQAPQPNPVYGHGIVNAYCAVTNDEGEGCKLQSVRSLDPWNVRTDASAFDGARPIWGLETDRNSGEAPERTARAVQDARQPFPPRVPYQSRAPSAKLRRPLGLASRQDEATHGPPVDQPRLPFSTGLD